jgi:type II secretory pathway pseudopilin PulG
MPVVPFLHPKASRLRAFSLIEIILAVAVIAFALTAILGMFPVAVGAATDSQRETQAALIARSIFNQLQARPETPTRFFTLAPDADDSDNHGQAEIHLDQAHIYPDAAVLDSDGKPLAGNASDPARAYSVDIAVAPLPAPSDKLSQVTVTVKTRSGNPSYPFSTLIRQVQ